MNKTSVGTRIFWSFFAALIAGGFYLAISFETDFSAATRVYFLDVGQGDSVLIRAPFTGHNILVDGGPNEKVLGELAAVLPATEKKIDLMVLTHPHADHLRGLIKVLEQYEVGAVLGTAVLSDSEDYHYFFRLLQEKQIPFWAARAQDDVAVGPLLLDVLSPRDYLAFQSVANLNDSSLVFKFAYGGNAVLLSGDAEIAAASDLYRRGADLSSLLFKAAHHGSKNGLFEAFLRVVDPKIVVVQSGKGNDYGHPHPETLARFADGDFFRNDEQGRLEFALGPKAEVNVAYNGTSTRLMSAPKP